MERIQKRHLIPTLIAAVALMTAVISFAQVAAVPVQNQSHVETVPVPAGQKVNVEGAIYTQQPDSMTVRSPGGAVYRVTFVNNPEVKEKKSNPFRGAKKYSKTDLVPGLHVEIKGVGDDSGSIAAKEIRFTQDEFNVAQTMDSRVVPVETKLAETQNRLGEAEQNAQRLSGQVEELAAVSNAARGGAKAAQETADTALGTATDARSRADSAKAGVQAANERITSLDDYQVSTTATIHFKVGSAVIPKEDMEELEKLAGQVKGTKGYLIEVAGFASADGNENYNRRLSQKRADAVIQFMAENYSIPLRRFVTPMGYGESQPVADNDTLSGRKENRRVEVRILISKGLTEDARPDMAASH